MADPLAPSEHSDVVGGSSASRMMNCPGHLDLVKQLPQAVSDESSVYADEGTQLHGVVAYVIDQDIPIEAMITNEEVLKLFEGLKDERWYDALVPAVRAFNEYIDELYERFPNCEVRLRVELKCAFPTIEGSFGTTDILIGVFVDDVPVFSAIWDWKFGSGVPVYASYSVKRDIPQGVTVPDDQRFDTYGNDQLMFYAAATRYEHPDYFGADPDYKVELIIDQPRIGDGTPSRHVVTNQDLNWFAEDLAGALAEARAGGAQKQRGHWCEFAPCKTICPLWMNGPIALAKVAEGLGRLKAQHELHASINVADPGMIAQQNAQSLDYGQRLGAMLQLREIAQPYFSEVDKQAHAFLEAGGTIPGYKLVPKKATGRSWIDPVKAERWLARQGIELKERRVVEVLSAPKSETLLKSKGIDMREGSAVRKQFDKYVQVGVSSGTTVAPEDDSRPAVRGTEELINQLALKIGGAAA